MAGIKEIRNRIASVASTQKITSAMKMVSAAKLRKAQQAVLQMRPYSDKLQEILQNVSNGLESNEDNPYSVVRPQNKVLIVAVASNSGLCGGFNSSIGKTVVTLAQNDYAGCNVDVFAIGKKVADSMKSKGIVPKKVFAEIFDKLTYDESTKISSELMESFASGAYDKIVVVYNKFKNAATQIITTSQYLPIEQTEASTSKKINYDYIFEPNKEYIVNELIPKSLRTQFYNVLLESFASEHGARMTAMHKATDNASELLKELRIEYNKARQAAITNELNEIVSGANALKG
ncbi:MAG: ATP synthase F1 subunit gamma [Bacteroidales bacterium]|nr:ATP synthase F1 subunit gamma [Bacteroidales bacterium]